MGLCDACSDFLATVDDAAKRRLSNASFLKAFYAAEKELAEAVEWYGRPDYPINYGEAAYVLRRACQAVDATPNSIDAIERLVQTAMAVMRWYDTPPSKRADTPPWRALVSGLPHSPYLSLIAS